MISLSLLFWIAFFAALISFWWHSDKSKSAALAIATQHCKLNELQLLDQSMVIRGIWPMRDDDHVLRLRRRYQFEFTSTGEQRYRGELVLLGTQLQSMALEPYIIP
jgi:hypothetical protein